MIALGVIIGIIVILAMVAIGYKNKFVVQITELKILGVKLMYKCKIDSSLVPNLVETVKGYAKHEKETFEGIANAKTRYMSATTPEEKMEANNQLSGFLGRLFAISEAYPELKANTSFENLQAQLVEVENKIRFARQFYNDTVTEYNQTIQMFPGSLFAGFFNYHNAELFKANDMAREEVQVKF